MKNFPIHSAAGISLWLYAVNIFLIIAAFLLENAWLFAAGIAMSSMLFYLQNLLSKSMSNAGQEQQVERAEEAHKIRV